MQLDKTKRIAVKKLPTPIRTIINIRVRRWFDKYYGNSYHSMRILVNNDYANELVISMQYGSYDNVATYGMIAETFAIKCRKYKLYGDAGYVPGSIQTDDSILVVESFADVTKRECKAFGGKNV